MGLMLGPVSPHLTLQYSSQLAQLLLHLNHAARGRHSCFHSHQINNYDEKVLHLYFATLTWVLLPASPERDNRLLRLNPQSRNKRLTGSIFHISLKNPTYIPLQDPSVPGHLKHDVPYEAISYTWGRDETKPMGKFSAHFHMFMAYSMPVRSHNPTFDSSTYHNLPPTPETLPHEPVSLLQRVYIYISLQCT